MKWALFAILIHWNSHDQKFGSVSYWAHMTALECFLLYGALGILSFPSSLPSSKYAINFSLSFLFPLLNSNCFQILHYTISTYMQQVCNIIMSQRIYMLYELIRGNVGGRHILAFSLIVSTLWPKPYARHMSMPINYFTSLWSKVKTLPKTFMFKRSESNALSLTNGKWV